MDLWQALAGWARQRPGHLAVRSPQGQLTYAQLAGRAHALGQQLFRSAEPRIGILTGDPVEMAIGFHAASLAGKALVVLDPAWPRQLLSSMVRKLQCTRAIVSAHGVSNLADLGLGTLAFEHESRPGPWTTAGLPPNRDLLVICTSGSTAEPKAVIRTAASWQQSLEIGASALRATPQAVTLCPSPISHGVGLYALVESLHTGGTFLGTGKFNQQEVNVLLSQAPCNRIVSVPAILDLLLEGTDPASLSAVRCTVSGGEPLSERTVERLHALDGFAECHEYFGSTEHSLIAYRQRTPGSGSRGGFEGRLFPGVQLHIHDADPVTGYGAAYISSPFNATRYDPETAEPMEHCGQATSIGDTAVVLEDDRVRFTRRADGMLNLHGNNIHPGEISAALDAAGLAGARIQLDGVSPALRLVAYVRAPAQPAGIVLRRLQERLPAYKVPHEIVFLRRWPLTFSGKLSTAGLRADSPEVEKRVLLR